jgi:hypothetical protein
MGRSIIPSKMTALERDNMVAFLQDPSSGLENLDQDQQFRIEAMSTAHDLIRTYKYKKKVVPMLIKHIQASRGVRVSKAYCYSLLRDTMYVFGSTFLGDKEAERAYLAEDVREMMERAAKKSDYNAYARLAELYAKLHKMDKDEDSDAPIMEPHVVIIRNDPNMLPNGSTFSDEKLDEFLRGFRKQPQLSKQDIEIIQPDGESTDT